MTGTKQQESPPRVLSLIIPAYNEEDGILEIIDRVLATRSAIQQTGLDDLELIVVDDGSSDATVERVKNRPEVRLVSHARNRGYGAALKTGFAAAQGELLGFLDADGTYPPEAFPDLCQQVLDGADIAVGSRRSGASSEMPMVRRLGNLIWANLVSLLAGQRVVDPASGMRVFRASILEQLYPLPDGLNFTPVMSTRTVHEGLRLVEVPIYYKERLGQSKLHVVRDGLRFLQTIIWTAMYYNPVRIFGGLGALSTALGILIAGILVAMRIAGVTQLGVWGVTATFVAVVAGIIGIDMLSLGIAFNFLVAMFHKTPIRQGLFSKSLLQKPLDRQFGWSGSLAILAGLGLGIISLLLGLSGWQIERLWLYLLAGTMLILIGVQLIIFWFILRILEDLSQRDIQARNDFGNPVR